MTIIFKGDFWNIFTRKIREFSLILSGFFLKLKVENSRNSPYVQIEKTYSSDIGGIFIDSFDSLLSVHVDGPLHPFSNFLLSYVYLKND